VLVLARELGIECGLVTNGLAWSRARPAELELADESLTWLRMSIVDTTCDYDIDQVRRVCDNLPHVDVGLSFTVTGEVNMNTAVALARLVNRLPNLTHVRFVQDIVHPVRATMDQVVAACGPITTKAIFQYRDRYTPGASPCLLSKLKPLVGADGYVYPCCGVQYAAEQVRCLPERFRMGRWSEFHNRDPFDGSVCRRCFYHDYNRVLARLAVPLTHEVFL
jgi:hypothetical protein